jgi:predicted enzyme related to lactoylglutathione lyase
MLEKVAFTMLPVSDVDRARDFYEKKLGLRPGLQGGQDGQHWIEYDLPGGGCIAITNATPNQPSASSGSTVAFEVSDLDALMSTLRDQGVPFRTDVIRGPTCRMSVCEDPEGNGIILHQLDQRKD